MNAVRIYRGIKFGIRRAGLRRSRIAAIRICCERNLLSTLARPSAQQVSRILCYHSVGTPEWSINDVTPACFRRHLQIALQAGYRFVPAERIASGSGGPQELAITFDDGLASVAANAAPILAEFGIPWTMFVVSDWAEGRHPWGDGIMLGWDGIEQLAASGVTIASHSVSHANFGRLERDAAFYELATSRRVIEERLGIQTREFAIPMGQSKDWNAEAATAARRAGYELVYAQAVDKRAPGTIARTFITRFDDERVFKAALAGRFDRWQEWV
jgi:peptidoglycan/xylan/chitin deacetylase (PgdA/CDA1 family)